MVNARLNKLVVSGLSALVLAGFSLLGVTQSAYAITCDNSYSGNGSMANPWVVSTTNQLSCFTSGLTPAPSGGGHAYLILGADITWDNLSLVDPGSTVPFHFDGQGYTVTISNVTGTSGLFANTSGDEVKNLHIASSNSTLANNAGWFTAQDTGSSFTNVSSDGYITPGSGGIIGIANSTSIDKAFSTGVIAASGGGIVGSNSQNVTISNSYSTGYVADNAGGIVGQNSSLAVVISAYSLGNIGTNAGGIIGADALGPTISNVYAVGAIGSNGGGIVGINSNTPIVSHAFSANAPLIAPGANNPIPTNSAVGSGSFNNALALANLSPLSAWGDCVQVNPDGFYLTAITPVNPCNAPTPTPTPVPSPTNSSSPALLAQTSSPFSIVIIGGAMLLLGAGVVLLLRKQILRKN